MNKKIKVKNRLIGEGEPIFLTAEIGVAHSGDFEIAKMLLYKAKEAGCDGADMFMTTGDDFYHYNVPLEEYKVDNKNIGSIDLWKKNSFDKDQWRELFKFAEEIDITLYLTPLDSPSIDMAVELGSPMLNINSNDLNNSLYLKHIAKKKIPVTVHDINATLAEVEGAVCMLIDAGCKDIILLHSTQETGDAEVLYETANLNVMNTYKSAFSSRGVMVGCVEHTTSKFLIYAVAALKPVLISKHLLYKHAENVADNVISFEAEEMKEIIRNVRYVESALGSGSNIVVCDKNGNQPDEDIKRRKVIVARRNIKKSKVIVQDDLAVKRPGNVGGLHPWFVNFLCGARAKVNIKNNTILNLNMFEDFKDIPYKPYNLEKRYYRQKRKGA